MKNNVIKESSNIHYYIPMALVAIFSGIPLLGYFNQDMMSHDDMNLSGFYSANLIHFIIVLSGTLLITNKCKKSKVWWGRYSDDNYDETMNRMVKMSITLIVITFVTYGHGILSGENRGDVRVMTGSFGWLATFSQGYGMRSIMALSTIYYFYLAKNKDHVKKKYIIILLCGLFSGLMEGGKANLIFIIIPVLLQCGSFLNFKKIIVISVLGILSVIVIGTIQMNMSFDESVIYNVYRATDLAAYGSMGVWDKYPNGSGEPYLVLLTSTFGEKITSLLTGVDRHTEEFLKYSFSRLITYDYYQDYIRALEGKVNLTITSFGEGVFWFGRRYYFVTSLLGAIIIHKIIKGYFYSMKKGQVIRNIIYTNFLMVFIIWQTSSTGFVICNFVGMTSLIYLTLSILMVRIVMRKSKLIKSYQNI